MLPVELPEIDDYSPQALDPDELIGREMLAEYEHPAFGTVRSVGLPLHLGDFTPEYHRGPALGADTDAILGDLGYDDARIAELEALLKARGDG